MRPMRGYWIANESDSYGVIPCRPPAQDRCVGWNMTSSSSQCGIGYGPDTPGCTGCASGYFKELQTCQACPPSKDDMIFVVLRFVAVIAGLFVVTFGIIVAVTRSRGGTVSGGVFRARDFVSWTMITWQTIIQVGKRSSGAPWALQQFYAVISVLELDTTVILSPQCYSSFPFTHELYEFIGSIIAVSCCVALFAVPFAKLPRAIGKRVPLFRRLSMTLLTLTYPLVTTNALDMIYCAKGRVVTSDDSAIIPTYRTALLLQSNTGYECYTGPHTTVGALAWIVLFTHVLGFPLVSFGYLLRKRRLFSNMTPQWRTTWMNFVANDFKPDMFWFVHWNIFTLFILSLVLVFGTKPSSSVEVGTFLVTLGLVLVSLALYFKMNPYLPRKQWKQPVKAVVLGVTLASGIGNLIQFFAPKSNGSIGWSYIVFLLCIGLILLFAYKFWKALLEGAMAESLQKPDAAGDSSSSGSKSQSADAPSVIVNPMMAVKQSVKMSGSSRQLCVFPWLCVVVCILQECRPVVVLQTYEFVWPR